MKIFLDTNFVVNLMVETEFHGKASIVERFARGGI